MTTQEYLAESAALCEAMMKWPEWEDEDCEGRVYRLCVFHKKDISPVVTWQDCGEGFGWASQSVGVSIHQAACIFEHHWRVWLEGHRIYSWNMHENLNDFYDDYLEAQIAAVKSKMEASE